MCYTENGESMKKLVGALCGLVIVFGWGLADTGQARQDYPDDKEDRIEKTEKLQKKAQPKPKVEEKQAVPPAPPAPQPQAPHPPQREPAPADPHLIPSQLPRPHLR